MTPTFAKKPVLETGLCSQVIAGRTGPFMGKVSSSLVVGGVFEMEVKVHVTEPLAPQSEGFMMEGVLLI